MSISKRHYAGLGWNVEMVRYALNRIEMSLFTIIFFVEDEYEGNTTDQVAHLCHIIEINIINHIKLQTLVI